MNLHVCLQLIQVGKTFLAGWANVRLICNKDPTFQCVVPYLQFLRGLRETDLFAALHSLHLELVVVLQRSALAAAQPPCLVAKHVGSQVDNPCESLAADRTHKFLDLVPILVGYVESLVLGEERLVRERLATDVTSERLLSRMCSDVRR